MVFRPCLFFVETVLTGKDALLPAAVDVRCSPHLLLPGSTSCFPLSVYFYFYHLVKLGSGRLWDNKYQVLTLVFKTPLFSPPNFLTVTVSSWICFVLCLLPISFVW